MDNIEATDKVLSISSQCCLLGISRSQYYYQPSLGRQEKDFKLLVEIKKVQAEHPYYGYRRILERDGQKGVPHLGDCSTSGDEKIWNCCNISWQESFQGQQVPQEVSVSS